MNTYFSKEDIGRLSAEIDYQLEELQATSQRISKSVDDSDSPLARQRSAIEKVAHEPIAIFLKKFRKAAKSDLCDEGGKLNAQWQKWANLDNDEVVDRFSAILVTMGFTGNVLEILVVSLAVIVIHIGVKAFCEEYSE